MTLTNYWWLLIWLFTGGAALAMFFPRQQELVLGEWEQRWNIVPAILLVLPYIIWAGHRGNFADTTLYRATFLQTPTALSQIPVYIDTVTKDKGFYAVMALMHCLMGDNPELYFTLMAGFQIVIVALVCRKYTRNYWMAIFLFIASTDYISWVWNGMRQFTAVAIIFAATGLIVEQKYVRAILCILLASVMHQSALLMLPILFVVQGKSWNKKTLIAIGLSVMALVFASQFTSFLDTALADTQYTNVVSDWTIGEDDGTNPLRILVYAMPAILSVIGYQRICEEDSPLLNVGVNAAIITTCIGLVSMGTSGIFIGRLLIYVSTIANWILLPWEIENIFYGQTAKMISIAAVLCYIVFFYYQMRMAWGIM